MKKIYFLAFAIAGLLFVNAQIINDDFESYSSGSYFGAHWDNWSHATGSENIIVTEAYAASGSKSGTISVDGQDALLKIDPIFEGKYTLQWKMFIPTDKAAWIGFMESVDDTELPAPPMPMKMYFNMMAEVDGSDANNTLILGNDAGDNTVSLVYGISYPINEWATYTLSLDLDNMTYDLKINGQSVYSGAYPSANYQFGGADLWKFPNGFSGITDVPSTNDDCEWYIDDVIFQEGDLSTNDVNDVASIAVYPTMVTNSFTVSSKSAISQVSVLNLEGKQVMSVKPNKNLVQVNTSSLPAGVYVVKTVSGKETKSTKIIVK